MADNPRQDLYLEISRNLVDQELTDLRNYVSGAKILPAGFVQHADAQQICNQLEKEQKSEPGNLSLLAGLLRKIGRNDYAEQAEKIAEDERKDTFQKLEHLLTEVRVKDGSQADTYNRLARHVAESGLTFRDEVPKDGNCMFHAVADQLLRTEGRLINHMQLRQRVVGFLRGNPYNTKGDNLSAFIPDQNWDGYLSLMSRDGTWGDHIVLQAMADLLRHDISIVSSVETENYVTILTPSSRTVGRKEPPLLLRHYAENHYASLDASPQPCTSRLKRKGEDGEEFPVRKKPATCREEGSPVGEVPSSVPVPAAGTESSSLTEVLRKSVNEYYELKLTYFKPLIWNENFTLTLRDIFTQLELIPKSEKQPRTSEKYNISESIKGEHRKKIKSLDDLFKPDVTGLSKAPRCILIEGEAGGGKTTFLSKEALDAVLQKTELGRLHHIVLLIRLREAREGETIEEMMWDQCVPQTIEGIDVQSIRAILQREKSRLLFLLDGYDELQPEARAAGQAIPKLLSGKLYPNSTIVITSRPSAGVQQYTRPDCHVHIMGFSPEHAEEHVKKYFSSTENPELAEDFISQYFTVIDDDVEEEVDDYLFRQHFIVTDDDDEEDNDNDDEEDDDDIDEEEDDDDEDDYIDDDNGDNDNDRLSDHSTAGSHGDEEEKVENTAVTSRYNVVLKDNELLNNLILTPMFLMFICVLWEEDQKMVSTGTMTGLYDNLLTCLVRKYCKREGVDMPTEGLPTEVAESFLQVGKLALKALLKNETLVDLTEVKRKNVNCELLLKLGLVSLEVSSSKLHPRKQMNFFHKTMQEFLAGRYVAHALVNQDIVEHLQLTSISKVFELSNLLQFTCGCDSRAAQAVMKKLSNLSKKEFSHLRPDDFQEIKSHLPVKPEKKKSIETYKRFVLLCLDVLNERKEPDVLQAVSRALPVIIMDLRRQRKQHAAPKYFLENIQSLHLPDKMILKSSHVDVSEALQYLERIVPSPIPGLKVDLRLEFARFNSLVPDKTVQHLQQCLPGLRVDLKLFSQFDSPDETARLVSVLKNVPGLRVLDLSDTFLTPSSLQPFRHGFSHMSLLEVLDLTGNPDLGDAGMEVLQVGMSSVVRLAVLRLGWHVFSTYANGVHMTADGMSSLAPYMRHLVGLRVLDISGNEVGDTGLESLTTVLSKFTAMQVLGLSNINISPRGMRTLVTPLCQLTRLIKLDISRNDIGDPGLECLAAILHHLTAMKVLDLSETGISDLGISSLIKALPHLVQLQEFDVRYNNIGDSGIVSLVQTLCQPSSLDMEQNPPGDKSLTTAPHCNTTLQELDIRWNRGVTGAGLGRVAQLISALPALTWLGMSGDRHTPAHLSDTAAMALAEALPRLPALERLDLLYISMEPAGFQAVVQAAEEHTTLEELGYTERLVPEGADTTASCLSLRRF
ncbi:uncharacterized protein LOC144874192 [Branchiostoma floridae x Branchiostoma japonicum]